MKNRTDQLDLFGPGEPEASAPTLKLANVADLLAEMTRWAEAGWLRWLDVALGRFLSEQTPDVPTGVVWSVVMLSCLEGQGHTCLEVGALCATDAAAVRRRSEWLGWPAPGLEAFERVRAALGAVPGELDAALRASTAVQVVPDALCVADPTLGAQSARPCVWVPEGGRLYLRRHWRDEQKVAGAVLARVAPQDAPSRSTDAADSEAATVRHWLDRLFPEPVDLGPGERVDWQRVACAVALNSRLALITGGPGTGKTYTVARLLALLEATHTGPAPLRMALAAPTGKAAARLKQSIDGALSTLQAQLGDEPDLSALMGRIGAARTLHSLLGARPDTRRMARHARHPLDVDVLVVDEASMVHLEMMAWLLDALPPRARLVLLGDKDQLASVEAGSVLGDLCRRAEAGDYRPETVASVWRRAGQRLPSAVQARAGATVSNLSQHTVMLRESRRFAGAIGRLAVAVNQGQVSRAWQVLRDTELQVQVEGAHRPDRLNALILRGRPGAVGGFERYADLLASGPSRPSDAEAAFRAPAPEAQAVQRHERWVVDVLRAFDAFRLLTAVREGEWGVAGLNARAESVLASAGRLHPRGEWYEGRPVMVTRNDPALGVYNGDVGVALRPPPRSPDGSGAGRGWRVYFLDGEQVRSVLASRLHHIETAFAMTVHKSQGSEFEHTVLVLPPQGGQVLTRELVYTGITRARQAFTLVAPDPRVFDAALERRTWRASGLPTLMSE